MSKLRRTITVEELRLLKYLRESARESVVGIIGDTHEPFCHENYIDFVEETFDRMGVTQVVHIGDEVDQYAMSFYGKATDSFSPEMEAEKARQKMERWYERFPDVKVCIGNHTDRFISAAEKVNIPKRFLKEYNDIWGAPKGWIWRHTHEIDGVLYFHGSGLSSKTAALDAAIKQRQSVVIGHIHTNGGVMYSSNFRDTIFGMSVGCGVDYRNYAFDYQKKNLQKPVLGCGIVRDGREALFIPMHI